MIKNILSVSGKPGLYRLVSRGKSMLIVESIIDKKRIPIYNHENVISLGDIAIYTDSDDRPLSALFEDIKAKFNGAVIDLDYKKASKDDLDSFLESVLPNFDHDRVYPSDIKKIVQWYNLMINNGITDFHDESLDKKEEKEEKVAEEKSVEEVEEKEEKAKVEKKEKKTTKAKAVKAKKAEE
jgi:septum formation inhibitor MinC